MNKLFEALDLGVCTFDEFANTITDTMIYHSANDSEYIPRCIARMSAETLNKYVSYLENLLLPVDFMPNPGGFILESTDENIRLTKLMLRPKYLYLFQVVQDAVNKQQTESK
jgi:hypothetical protein